jgi:hypothetical protein
MNSGGEIQADKDVAASRATQNVWRRVIAEIGSSFRVAWKDLAIGFAASVIAALASNDFYFGKKLPSIANDNKERLVQLAPSVIAVVVGITVLLFLAQYILRLWRRRRGLLGYKQAEVVRGQVRSAYYLALEESILNPDRSIV